MKRSLKYDIEEAEKKRVKIVTVEDLSYLVQAIRNNDAFIITMIQYYSYMHKAKYLFKKSIRKMKELGEDIKFGVK